MRKIPKMGQNHTEAMLSIKTQSLKNNSMNEGVREFVQRSKDDCQ